MHFLNPFLNLTFLSLKEMVSPGPERQIVLLTSSSIIFFLLRYCSLILGIIINR